MPDDPIQHDLSTGGGLPPDDGPTPQSADDAGGRSADEFDAANASLANALSLSFSVLRFLMLALVAVFLFSGFFTVEQNEVAVRARFGRIVPDAAGSEVLTAEGGPYFRWPAPIGQVYRIPTTRRTVFLDRSFVFAAAARQPGTPLSDLNDVGQLDPETDSALITADKNVVHARYSVTYQVLPENAAKFVRNVASVEALERGSDDPDAIFADAAEIVARAVEQAVVADVAATTLDEFLQGSRAATPATPPAGADTQSPPADAAPATLDQPAAPGAGDAEPNSGDEQAVGASESAGGVRPVDQDRIRNAAQVVLDGMNTGITIVEVLRTDQGIPSDVRPAFEQVTVALSQRGELVSQAEAQAGRQFTGAAGNAYRAVLAVIDAYEEATRVREANPQFYEQAEAALVAVFDGRPLGEALTPLAQTLPEGDARRARLEGLAREHADDRLGGQAATIVGRANSTAAEYIGQLESDAREFEQLLATYREQPELVKLSLFNKTLRNVFASPTAETEFVTPGSRVRLNLNRDVDRRREEEQRAREQRGQQTPQ